MSFLFKSKKAQPGGLSGSRNIASADGQAKPLSSSLINGDSSRIPQSALNGSNSSLATANADPKLRQRSGSDVGSQNPPNFSSPPSRAPPDLSLYPWSQRRIDFVAGANPFPRYGAAVNASASKDGEVYIMGGLINGSTVKGDLWMVEAGSSSLPCYHVATTSEGPGPRVGHASLLVGNAFIVFGGDTKVDEGDILDDTLYLLNTATKQWSRALPTGQKPSGRYGHTLNMLGTRIFIFGGQVEGYFFNDLIAFDLNKLQDLDNHWEVLIQNSNDGGPPQGLSPPARTNHTVITWNDKLYLFGGTNGVQWFNDVWAYDPRVNSWAQQECIGFIPTAREGHAAALVGDVMYIFGGRTKDGTDLGDLTAFRLSTRRWYTFHNMGPSPSSRSGHSMTAIGKQILVIAGEPSSAPPDANELSLAYILDTEKIRYPNDQPSQIRDGRTSASGRRSSAERSAGSRERSASREGAYGQEASRSTVSPSPDIANGAHVSPPRGYEGGTPNGYPLSTRAPRSAAAPAGPPPLQQPPPPQQQSSLQPEPLVLRSNGVRPQVAGQDIREAPRPTKLDRMLGPEHSTGLIAAGATAATGITAAAGAYVYGKESKSQPPNRNGSLTKGTPPENSAQQGSFDSLRGHEVYVPPAQYQNTTPGLLATDSTPVRNLSRSSRQRPSLDSNYLESANTSDAGLDTAKGTQPTLQMPGAFPVDSGIGSSPALTQQNDELMKELENSRNKNAWYASELELARKAGYQPSAADFPVLDERGISNFNDDDKPLVEALLAMKSEISNLQSSLESQANAAAAKIAQVEQQRDAAIHEAVYAKHRLVAQGGSRNGTPQLDDSRGIEDDRSQDVQSRLASTLASHNTLASQLAALTAEVETERKARQLAEETANSMESRVNELDLHKQESTSELERLRTELHEAEQAARDHAANFHEANSSRDMLQVDKNELTSQLTTAQSAIANHSTVLSTLQAAVLASTNKATLLEGKFDNERQQRSVVEEKFAQLKTEHEARTRELDTAQNRLRDAEDLAQHHANEAQAHRDAVLTGFGNITSPADNSTTSDERVSLLQQKLDAANALVRSNQEAADRASERLRRAEERIAGLEAYQEQISREGLTMRKQVQGASRDTLGLRAELADLQQQLAGEKMNSTALHVQHTALKNVLNERGINFSDYESSSRSIDGGAEQSQRLQELQAQLDASSKAHEEMRATFEQREQDANKGWEAKLTALDTDYQAAVKYLKGTEKMLTKMKQELNRQKTANKELEEELATRSNASSNIVGGMIPTNWESERDELHSRLQTSQAQLDHHASLVRAAQADRDAAQAMSVSHQQKLTAATDQHNAEIEALKAQNRALETKATEAESRVQMLLDNVGKSVQTYRRHSRNLSASNTASHTRGISGTSNLSDFTGGSTDGAGDEHLLDDDDDDMAGRNSLALDSLASELETLRTHWESSKSWRESGGSDVLASSSTAATAATVTSSTTAVVASTTPATNAQAQEGELPGGMI